MRECENWGPAVVNGQGHIAHPIRDIRIGLMIFSVLSRETETPSR